MFGLKNIPKNKSIRISNPCRKLLYVTWFFFVTHDIHCSVNTVLSILVILALRIVLKSIDNYYGFVALFVFCYTTGDITQLFGCFPVRVQSISFHRVIHYHHQPHGAHCWAKASPKDLHDDRSCASRIQGLPVTFTRSSVHLLGLPTERRKIITLIFELDTVAIYALGVLLQKLSNGFNGPS
jgi:hypothetical protein